MQRIVFINSHPIQYFVPLYQQITREQPTIDLTVLYLTTETVHGYQDRQFGTEVNWGLPLLEGYRYRFLMNHSPKPSLYHGFFGLINWGLVGELRRMPKSIVVSHGWAYASNLIALMAAKAFGHTVCLRGDNPLKLEAFKTPWKRRLRNLFLRVGVFSVTDYVLPVGRQNRQLFASFGIADHRMISVPHAVDNQRFRHEHRRLQKEPGRGALTTGLNGKRIVLYVGKLIDKKRPMDLLRAYEQLTATHTDLALVFVGDGALRAVIKAYAQAYRLADVHITGFVNQRDIARYYALAHVFVMCSGPGETWGLAVNEAMNFGLPIVASDLVGCADDLVELGVNGYTYPAGDITALAKTIRRCLDGAVSGQASLERVQAYSYEAIIDGLKAIPVAL